MAIPGTPGASVPPGEDYLVRRIADLERVVKELAAADPLRTAGIRVTGPDAVQVVGSLNTTSALDVDGPMNVDGTMTVGASTTVNGPMTVNGAMAITGTLSLPAGIIDNEALANPLEPGSVGVSSIGHAVTTTNSDVAVTTITIPAGYTRAIIMCVVNCGAFNSAAVPDYLYVSARIGTAGGGELVSYAAAGTYANASASAIRTLTGLSGGTVTVAARVRSGSTSWGAQPSNAAHVNAIALFLR